MQGQSAVGQTLGQPAYTLMNSALRKPLQWSRTHSAIAWRWMHQIDLLLASQRSVHLPQEGRINLDKFAVISHQPVHLAFNVGGLRIDRRTGHLGKALTFLDKIRWRKYSVPTMLSVCRP